MTKVEAIEWLKSLNYCDGEETQEVAQAIDMAIKALEQRPIDEQVRILNCENIDIQKFTEAMKHQPPQVIQPSKDCVSLEVYKQVVWERDIAIEQLKELGYSFGEKIRTSDDCVSRKDVLEMFGYETTIYDLPPVTPTQCIAAFRFSKKDLIDICNERIEIECTHGTCKDCKHNYKTGRNTFECSNGHRFELREPSTFYCADYEKRGNSDGSN